MIRRESNSFSTSEGQHLDGPCPGKGAEEEVTETGYYFDLLPEITDFRKSVILDGFSSLGFLVLSF